MTMTERPRERAPPGVNGSDGGCGCRICFERWFEAPYSSMVHDFAVTENHIVFPIVPLISDLRRLKAGCPHFAWERSKPVYLGVAARRDPTAPIGWFVGENRFASHMMNAYESGEQIHIDTSVGDSVAFPFFPEVGGAAFDPVVGEIANGPTAALRGCPEVRRSLRRSRPARPLLLGAFWSPNQVRQGQEDRREEGIRTAGRLERGGV